MTDRRPVEQDAAVERDVRVDRFPEGRAAPPPAPPVGVREPVRPPHRAAATMEREATNVRTEPAAGPWRGSGLVLGTPEGYWRDRVRWGPIWGGLVIALAGFVLLSAAAVAIGAQAWS